MCNLIKFGLGAFSYGLIEILWRGYTHWSMMIAGGLCFMSFASISEKFRSKCLAVKCVIGSLTVTVIEFLFGFVFNIVLKKHVWDYSDKPFNLFGQVCLLFTLLWGLLCVVAIPLADKINKKLRGKV